MQRTPKTPSATLEARRSRASEAAASGARAMSDYTARSESDRRKTERLKALRLTRDAEVAKAAAEARALAPPKKRASRAKKAVAAE